MERALFILMLAWATSGWAQAADPLRQSRAEQPDQSERLELLELPDDAGGDLPAGWVKRVKLFAGGRRHEVEVRAEAGRPAICLSGDRASFSVDRHVEVDLRDTPIVAWDWLVGKHPERGDARDDDTDDQAAQLQLAFRVGPLSYKALSYVWDPNAPAGYTRMQRRRVLGRGIDVKIVVVESGDTNDDRWVRYRRNALADAADLLDGAEPVVSIVRYQANSQYTEDTVESCLNRLVLLPQDQAEAVR